MRHAFDPGSVSSARGCEANVSEPRVSVVTPVYNTAAYLAECIESVLSQTHQNFEYILTDNRSTDGSHEIALSYAQRDSRVRVLQNASFVSQLENYNGAFRQIDTSSRYVKLASADDILYPECLAQLVAVAEQHPKVGLVGSYFVTEEGPGGSGVPFGVTSMPGRQICRDMLLNGCFPLGTPTSVLYRADIVRSRSDFYHLAGYHFDTETAYAILLDHDFGFSHQVSCFLRSDDASITGKRQSFHPNLLDLYVVLERYGPEVLGPEEFATRRAQVRGEYLRFLGRSALRGKGRDFWDYHRKGLSSLGEDVKWRNVLPHAFLEATRMALSPDATFEQAFKELRARLTRKR
jgi:glycosyltransferase involved in cell wall biosynthesis